ncbi:DUF6090 family protein [Flavihumibacter solisilvae]|nr:DUF6090 family protein [Flavihumibacter solisilvae]
MREELTKHCRKIYHILKYPTHTLAHRLKEITIEVCIIIFAVSLSIWFHSWSEYGHEKDAANAFLRGLKDDLSNDLEIIEKNKSLVTTLCRHYESILNVKKDNPAGNKYQDSVISRNFKFEIVMTHPNIGRYEGFKSSGKIGTIQDGQLKEQILAYYQQTNPNLAFGENYINSLQQKIMYLAVDGIDNKSVSDLARTRKMQILFRLALQNFALNLEAYSGASHQIRSIIDGIDGQS